jgi:hypothetical protein
MKSQYMVLQAASGSDLAAFVEQVLRDGWQLAGGVSVASHEERTYEAGDEYFVVVYTYAQAVTRRVSAT